MTPGKVFILPPSNFGIVKLAAFKISVVINVNFFN
jgi:hypothetical protein